VKVIPCYLVAVVETEVPTTCFEVQCDLVLVTAWIACYVCGKSGRLMMLITFAVRDSGEMERYDPSGTRTKESNMCASIRAWKPKCVMKVNDTFVSLVGKGCNGPGTIDRS